MAPLHKIRICQMLWHQNSDQNSDQNSKQNSDQNSNQNSDQNPNQNLAQKSSLLHLWIVLRRKSKRIPKLNLSLLFLPIVLIIKWKKINYVRYKKSAYIAESSKFKFTQPFFINFVNFSGILKPQAKHNEKMKFHTLLQGKSCSVLKVLLLSKLVTTVNNCNGEKKLLLDRNI